MRLTNEIRDQFLTRVMDSVKMKSKWNKDKMIAEVERRFKVYWPQEVHDFDALYPGLIGRTSLCIDFMSIDRSEEEDWNKRYSRANVYQMSKMENIKTDDLEKHWAAYRKELHDRKAMRAKLRQVVYEITTDTALAEAFPELVKFIPKPESKPAKMLPVTQKTLVAELVAMGLDA